MNFYVKVFANCLEDYNIFIRNTAARNEDDTNEQNANWNEHFGYGKQPSSIPLSALNLSTVKVNDENLNNEKHLKHP